MFDFIRNRSGKLGTLGGTPWSVENVKSNRTDTYDEDTGKFNTHIGNDMGDSGVGHTYQVDSTAIKSARFDPSDESLNITYRNGNKEYKFRADAEDAAEWLRSASKGRTTQEWRKTHRYPGYGSKEI